MVLKWNKATSTLSPRKKQKPTQNLRQIKDNKKQENCNSKPAYEDERQVEEGLGNWEAGRKSRPGADRGRR